MITCAGVWTCAAAMARNRITDLALRIRSLYTAITVQLIISLVSIYWFLGAQSWTMLKHCSSIIRRASDKLSSICRNYGGHPVQYYMVSSWSLAATLADYRKYTKRRKHRQWCGVGTNKDYWNGLLHDGVRVACWVALCISIYWIFIHEAVGL